MFLTIKAICVPWKAQVLTWGLQNQDKGEENVSFASRTNISGGGGTKKLSNVIEMQYFKTQNECKNSTTNKR